MNTPVPLVSIIVPVYGRFEVVNRAILSALNQSYPHWELIVVDDCSDDPYELPDSCKNCHQRIELLRNESNHGPGLSRQKGVDISLGDYICFLDSDDYYHPDFLRKSLTYHEKNPEITATYTTARYIHTDEIRPRSDEAFENLMPTLVTGIRPWPTCGLLWKKKWIARWKDLRTNQDYLFELDSAMINNNIMHVPEVLCFVDKGTEMNTDQLVIENKRLINRNFIFQYALRNSEKFLSKKHSRRAISALAAKRLVYSTSKIVKYGNVSLIIQNGSILLKHKPFTGLILILLIAPLATINVRSINKILASAIYRLI